MASVAAIGDWDRVQGFALAGALTWETATPADVRRAWDDLPDHVAVVVLTSSAARILEGAVPGVGGPGGLLTVVLPP